MIMDVDVDTVSNHTRDICHGIARWDAYIYLPDPDALAAEFSVRNVEFFVPALNLPFVVGTTLLSFALGLLCFPVLALNWRRLSAVQTAGVIACALVHASPFLFVVAFSTAVGIWGK